MTRTQTVFVVDDDPRLLDQVRAILKSDVRVRVATSGRRALEALDRSELPDLILLDVVMEDMSGEEVFERIKAGPRTRHVPVIFLTSRSDPDDEERGLDLGAVDYVVKPVTPAILRARVRTHLDLSSASGFLRDKAAFLEAEVERRSREVTVVQDATLVAVGSLAETRDAETGAHIRRTQTYVGLLATTLATHPRFAAILTPATISSWTKSAALHDIGKVGIPDQILKKPGKLTDDEYETMKLHTVYGRDALLEAKALLGDHTSFLDDAIDIAYHHQEKWDGTGYPQGLSGEEIPLSARLMAVADVYDALISTRVYKPAMAHDDAVRVILDGRGTHFDPDVVDAFARVADQFGAIARRVVATAPRARTA